MSIELRPYQREAVDGAFGAFEKYRSTIIVMPTATGKTIVFAAIADRFRPRGRVLVLAHREELITQAVDKIQRSTSLRCGVEMADQHVDTLFAPDVTVASVQTLARASRREKFAPEHFGLVIIDEAHHATSKTYREILAYFGPAKVLGVTATPDRSDGEAMGKVFDSVAFVYEIRDAIEQGFIVPVRQKAVQVEKLDFSSVRTTAGDLNEGDLEQILMEEEHLHGVAIPSVELSGARPTIVFATTVAHAHALAQVINRYAAAKGGVGEAARALDGSADSKLRRDTLTDFAAGRFRFLCNCSLFTEGFDAPLISCVAVARPTKSRALYAQMVGRGFRLSPETGKSDLLVLDFQGNAGKHALVNTLDILDGNADAEVRERAEKLLAQSPEATVLGALDSATKQLAEEKQQRALEEARRRKVQGRASYQSADVDPFTSVEVVLGVRLRAGRWAGEPATSRQIEFLKSKGIELNGIEKGQASQLIETLKDRQAKGLCTFKQARLLARHGLKPDIGFAEASKAIDELARNGWKQPGRAA